jgi:hypothetical protein
MKTFPNFDFKIDCGDDPDMPMMLGGQFGALSNE